MQAEAGVVQVESSNNEMLAAIVEAKRTIGQFLAACKNPQPNQSGFHLKVEFEAGDEVEHIWVTDLELDTNPISGVLANEGRLPGLTSGRRITFSKAQVTDWMYMEDGAMMGGYTTRVLMKMRQLRMTNELVETLRRKFGKKESIQ